MMGGKEERTDFALAKGLLFSCISPPHFLQEEPREDVVKTNVVIIEVALCLLFKQISSLTLSVTK